MDEIMKFANENTKTTYSFPTVLKDICFLDILLNQIANVEKIKSWAQPKSKWAHY